ncbi:MAG TPA: ATP-binding protein, partial [Rhodopila sp.]|nr:ATP-binding protein [Rhodopila sp.]
MPQTDVSRLGCILVLAPTGQDARTVGRVLSTIGLPVQISTCLVDLCSTLQTDGGAGIAALFIAEEAFAGGTKPLVAGLQQQPPWSDMPIVVLTAGGFRQGPWERWALFKGLGNVMLLQRPLHAETLRSAARAALRARARQHEARQHLEALRLAAETLEARVEERTRALMAVEERLHQAQKMEAIGQLTGGLAHDLNNLLTVIGGGAESLQRLLAVAPGLDEKRIGRALRMITHGSERAAALTHRLLAFSRRQTLDPKPTNVNQLIAGMEDMIRRTMGPAIETQVIGAAALWTTLVDPHQLENALLNLCINARDAMPDGGRLTIETANILVDDGTAREGGITPGRYIVVNVSDTGTGMPPDVVARAFDPFFTTKPLGQGTGLGLSMIYGFAQQSGGKVDIHSQLGQGTLVQIHLPQYAGAMEEERQQEPALAPRAKAAKTVLVVDDEPMVR